MSTASAYASDPARPVSRARTIAFVSSMSLLMAVLKWSSSMSSPTASIVTWAARRSARVSSSAVPSTSSAAG